MAKKKQQEYKIHELNISDAINLAGILAGGGLAGRAQDALAALERDRGAGFAAIGSLIMGALANHSVRDEMRGFIFDVWKTTEDEQATKDDLSIEGRLEPRYERDSSGDFAINPDTMQRRYDEKSLYYRKLKRFHQLPPSAFPALAGAIYRSEGFEDFLGALSGILEETSTASGTGSSEPTGLQSVK